MSSDSPSGQRLLSRSLAQHRDAILAHANDPAKPFRRFIVDGDVGTGKTVLLQRVAERCTERDLLVLYVAAPRVTYADRDSARDRDLADLYACSYLIGDFVTCIDTFAARHPLSRTAADRAITALRNYRSVARLHNLATAEEGARTHQALLAELQDDTESVLRELAHDYELAIVIDEVDLLDGTSVLDWLYALLRRIPSRCTVTARHPGNGGWKQTSVADGTQIIELRNMDLDEVGEYLRDRYIPFTDDEARRLFDWTGGHGVAVATWCDLAADAGADGFAGLSNSATEDLTFISLTERVQQEVDRIPVDVLGYRLPLFALLAVAEAVTPRLIAMLEGDAGQKPSEREAEEIYRRLVTRRFISMVDDYVERGAYLPRAISDVARRRLREQDPGVFHAMHSRAERYQRDLVDLDYELKQQTPFAAWLRFENPAWVRSVARWLDHAMWLDQPQFEKTKPALVKIYLDAFWWWDDYLRSAATSILKPALRRVADQQQDQPWVKSLESFSDHWISSWDEQVLRPAPREWRLVLDAIRRLMGMFGLRLGQVPADLERRRIYILLCNFYGKAYWYAGEPDERRAEEADRWLAAAEAACRTQEGEQDKDNPNGWIGSWARYRRAEIWAALDPRRAGGYLQELDRKAIKDEDRDVRVGIATLIGDLLWQSLEFESAFHTYSRALLISYSYNIDQEATRKAPNRYTAALYAATIKKVQARVKELEQAGELEMLDAALDTMRQVFEVYWDRVLDLPDPPAPLDRFELPVPPPPKDSEISLLEIADENSVLETDYVAVLVDLALSQVSVIEEPNELRIGRSSRTSEKPPGEGSRKYPHDGQKSQGGKMRIYDVSGPGQVVEDLYREILQPSFPDDELVDLDELQNIASRGYDASIWLAEDEDGKILGGAVAEWDDSARVLLLGYLAVRPGLRGGGVGGPLYLKALESWREQYKPCLIVAEIEDPAVSEAHDDYGHPDRRLRFYLNRGSRVLDIPYFQPALDPSTGRVSGLLLIVLHADPEFAGTEKDTIDPSVLRRFLENYQIQYEGEIGTDAQANALWDSLERPGGVRFREEREESEGDQ